MATPIPLRGTAQCLLRRSLPPLRYLHTSPSKNATPTPFAEIASAPPPAPEPQTAPSSSSSSAPSEDSRQSRRLRQAALLTRARTLRHPKKPLQTRFWKQASIVSSPDGYSILLDSRPVRTARKQVLTIPPSKHALAVGIAVEWDGLVSAAQALKNDYIPLTSLVSRALDLAAAEAAGEMEARDAVVRMVMRHLETDTLLCWAPDAGAEAQCASLFEHAGTSRGGEREDGRGLRELQRETAEPIMRVLTERVWPGVQIRPVLEADSIMPVRQEEVTESVIRGWVSGLGAWELAGLERAVLATKSLLVAVRLLVEWGEAFRHLRREGEGLEEGGRFGVEEARRACSLEVSWQTSMWGEVDDTHDVQKEDLRRQLGGVVLLLTGESA